MVHVVTGAASLVGAKLCGRLVAAGRRVVGVDDFSSGSFAYLAPLVRRGAMTFLEHDVSEPLRLAEGAEAVYHLALPSSRRTCEADPVRATLTCAAGTARMLALAEASDARVVLVTSDERSGSGLRAAEALASEAVRSRRADVRHVRVASPFDPGMVPEQELLVTRLVLGALRGEPLVDLADEPLRVCWADDAALTIDKTMRHDLRIPPVLAPAWEVTPRGLAGLVASLVGHATSAPETLPACAGETPSRGARSRSAAGRTPTLPETLPASLLLGLEPSLTLEAALTAMLEGFAARIAGQTGQSPERRRAHGLRAS